MDKHIISLVMKDLANKSVKAAKKKHGKKYKDYMKALSLKAVEAKKKL